jgi:hypothetical protein
LVKGTDWQMDNKWTQAQIRKEAQKRNMRVVFGRVAALDAKKVEYLAFRFEPNAAIASNATATAVVTAPAAKLTRTQQKSAKKSTETSK